MLLRMIGYLTKVEHNRKNSLLNGNTEAFETAELPKPAWLPELAGGRGARPGDCPRCVFGEHSGMSALVCDR